MWRLFAFASAPFLCESFIHFCVSVRRTGMRTPLPPFGGGFRLLCLILRLSPSGEDGPKLSLRLLERTVVSEEGTGAVTTGSDFVAIVWSLILDSNSSMAAFSTWSAPSICRGLDARFRNWAACLQKFFAGTLNPSAMLVRAC